MGAVVSIPGVVSTECLFFTTRVLSRCVVYYKCGLYYMCGCCKCGFYFKCVFSTYVSTTFVVSIGSVFFLPHVISARVVSATSLSVATRADFLKAVGPTDMTSKFSPR